MDEANEGVLENKSGNRDGRTEADDACAGGLCHSTTVFDTPLERPEVNQFVKPNSKSTSKHVLLFHKRRGGDWCAEYHLLTRQGNPD